MHKETIFKRVTVGVILAAFLAIMAGCGGSGSSSGTGGQTIIVSSSNVALRITNPSLAQSSTTPVSATFTKADGTPAVGIGVTFSTTMGTLTSSGVAITDASGVANITLVAGISSGQGQLTATATVDGKQVTSTALFSVNLPALHLANLRFTNNSSATVSYGSSQGIAVDVLDSSNSLYTAQAVDVVFNSPATTNGKATLSSFIQTVNGVASVTYNALTITGSDTITASISGSSITKTLNILPLNAGAISFVSASPASIGLKGMGGVGVQETSRITFKVVDTSGAPKANQPVNFSLSSTLGGLSLLSTSGSTAADGTVSTIVQSGIISTPVRVKASTAVGGNILSSQSDQLIVSTGVPAQDGLSVAFSNLNSESYNHDGAEVAVTARLSDHFHNPVPDGTAVYFTTTGGAIGQSCTTVSGGCSVKWVSQNPRPLNGRVVVLTYAVGEEAFIDSNGSGYADYGEFTPDTVAYRDDNFKCSLLAPSAVKACVIADQLPWLDFNSKTWSAGATHTFPDPDPGYIGIFQGVDSQGNSYSASGTPRLKHIFNNSQFVMSTDSAIISFKKDTVTLNPVNTNYMQVYPVDTTPSTITGPGRFIVLVTDNHKNTMAAGTTIEVIAPYGVLSGDTKVTVPQTTGTGQVLVLNLAATTTPSARSSDVITVKVTSPGGLPSSGYIPVTGTF